MGVVLARSLDANQFNWDVAWLLHVAERVLDGARLYTDVFDENPPLIARFSTPAVGASRVSPLPAIVVYDVLVAALAVSSCAISFRSIRLGWPEWPEGYSIVLVSLLLCLQIILPGIDYGQRENLLFIALTPYLFAASARLAGRPLPRSHALFAGAFCAPGLALKPFFVATWLAVDLGVIWSGRDRWRCPENAVIAGFIGLFYPWLLVFNDGYRAVIALMFRIASSYQGSGLAALRPAGLFLGVGALTAFWLFRPTARNAEIRRVSVIAAMTLLGVAIYQGADFSYRYYPAEASSLFVLGLVGLGLTAPPGALREALRISTARIPALCMAALLLWSGATFALQTSRLVNRDPGDGTIVTALARLVGEYARGKPIWLMSTSVMPAFPVVNLSGAKWSSRYCCVSFVASQYSEQERRTNPFPYLDMARPSELEKRQYDEVIEDLEAQPPVLIIIDSSSNKQAIGPSTFRFLTYFQRDPRFARFFRDYRPLTNVGPYRVFARRGL